MGNDPSILVGKKVRFRHWSLDATFTGIVRSTYENAPGEVYVAVDCGKKGIYRPSIDRIRLA